MKIAITGCGIAGTTAGFLLAQQGHAVTIYEQAEKCRPVGAGILIQPIGQTVLKQLKIYDLIEQQSARLDYIEAVKHTGGRLVFLEYQRLRTQLFGLGVHRGLLFSMLLDLSRKAGAQIRENSRISGYRQTVDGVVLEMDEEEQSEPFDCIVATDGARSILRNASGIRHRCVDYKYGALWKTGSCITVTDRLLQLVEGTKKLVGLLPIGKNQCSFFWGLTADQFTQYKRQGIEVWKKDVRQLCPQAEEILAQIERFEELTFTTYRDVSMESCWADRIVFLGDAAHPTSPHLGQGANLALEDVWEFTECLKNTTDFTIACRQFELLRRSKILYYQKVTRWLTPFFQSDGWLKGWGRDLFLPLMCQTPILREQMLKTLCGFKSGWTSSRIEMH
ncbi:FAD-dependent oxidoreductase [Gimesia algae]|uniref:FAD-dependent urate hydroxylase n=1 Tax=Gimesia algae TaxID=2527971 RepID=A0A517VFA7_9PLAN|nr:NAD(P)/FAD-dependent oxidoreductase [Gimesia algae]QDT91700.1 FAD-dependent urate hydroxylase [Gimesia algae]